MADGAGDDAFWRQLERDYYALLGLARDAPSDEVRARFLSLSREFHPDRQRRRQAGGSGADAEAMVAAANAQYALLDRAYKVLADPVRRKVYDLYGERGLHAMEQEGVVQQLAVGAHLKSADEVQRAVERALRRMSQQALEAQFSSFSEMSMNVDASDFVREPMQGLRSLFHSGARMVARNEMTIHQRTSFPLSRSNTLTVGGYMFDKQGLGLGSLTLQFAHASFDPAAPSYTVTSELGWTPKLHCQVTQPVSPHTAFMLIPELDDNGLDVSVGANHVLSPQLHGAMMWSTRDGLSGSLSHDAGAHSATAAVAVGRRGPNLSLQFRRGLAHASNAKLALKGNLVTGLSLVAGASKEVSDRTRLALGVALARAGITLRVGFTRGSVRFVMPIFLAPFAVESAFATFCAATTPFVVAAAVNQLVKPAQERKRRRALEQRREARLQYLATARSSAAAQQKLMRRSAQEKREQEQQRPDGKGLVILVAHYGSNPTSSDPRPPRDELADALDAMNARHVGDVGEDGDGVGARGTTANGEAELASSDSDADASASAEQQWVDVTIPLQFFVQVRGRSSWHCVEERGSHSS
jgi:DnaJ family protein C protein 11